MNPRPFARIALVGAGWWGQGWHLPHLSRNPKSEIAAIVDASPNPTSSLNPTLLPLADLGRIYDASTFQSVDDLLASDVQFDGVIVCTPHATHFELGMKFLARDDLHILMEKPFTTDVEQARALHDAVLASKKGGLEAANDGSASNKRFFEINHSANSRQQTRIATELVRAGEIGDVRHVTCFMGSPLAWIFEDSACRDWNEPTGNMIGNGFAWGQLSHILAWVYQVTGLEPSIVQCSMNYSETTGADIFDSGIITCTNGCIMNVSGYASLPGNAHAETPAGKVIDAKIFGSRGALLYGGDDRNPSSGHLEVCYHDGSPPTVIPGGFQFEDCEELGDGPASLQHFLDACCGMHEEGSIRYCGASSVVGLKTVQTIDAMYRSAQSGNREHVR